MHKYDCGLLWMAGVAAQLRLWRKTSLLSRRAPLARLPRLINHHWSPYPILGGATSSTTMCRQFVRVRRGHAENWSGTAVAHA